MSQQRWERLGGGWRLVSACVLSAALLAGASRASGKDDPADEAPPPAQKVKVFIFAGQSNMVGRSDPSKLPAEYRQPLANVRLYANQTWRPLDRPSPGRGDGVGPEVSAARLLAEALPGRKIVIVKTAVGGTNLHTQWDPKRKGSLYHRMLKDVQTGTAGQDVEIVAFFWDQGGSDSKDEAAARAYGKNLAAFIEQARKDLGRADLPFLFSMRMIDPSWPRSERYPFLAEVAMGKAEVAKTVPHTATVSTAGLTRKPDGHYDTGGTIEFGRRFFEAWKTNFHKPPAKTVEVGEASKAKP
ncbi:MAG: hypothetical protein BWX88_04432 [Planctomycetes bacterium ADurb.Bin126]|nr:MAG: hypothetical protein BWX88_04432 [Planctomycetes bacterium ADurb.Bin126]HOD82855.1 sialate O-acetylesterase [Phycisphaerae bacterium]